jgi:hypothetical protein
MDGPYSTGKFLVWLFCRIGWNVNGDGYDDVIVERRDLVKIIPRRVRFLVASAAAGLNAGVMGTSSNFRWKVKEWQLSASYAWA